MKLGSLFSGSGSFELAGLFCGITPIWNSEISPFPRAVTDKNLPNTKQLGDVTKINGAEVESVDIITFGSPCQDLSIAGKQAGIHNGTRSSLFFEAIRIIKEMRNATNNQYPRFAVWENVKNALSSHNGADFQAVLQAFVEAAGSDAVVPMPKGKWPSAGAIVGDGFSIAWKILDAQYSGVAQRRKRVYLVADFRGECADEILGDGESGGGNHKTRIEAWQEFAGYTGRGIKGSDCAGSVKTFGVQCRNVALSEELSPTICAKGSGGISLNCTPCVVYDARGNGDGSICPTITGDHENRITDYTAVLVQRNEDRHYFIQQRFDEYKEGDVASTLKQRDYKDNTDLVVEPCDHQRKWIIRRLTETECLSLQGLPKWWCDGVKGWSASAVYQLAGNAVALPCVIDVLGRIVDYTCRGLL